MANTHDNGQAKMDQLCFLQDNLSPNGFLITGESLK